MKLGMNSSEMQKTNRSLVLKLLLEGGSITRTELSNRTGLKKATITNIINEFLSMGIVAVDGEEAAGRRGELICLKLDGVYIISIAINRKSYRIALYSVVGQRIRQIRYEFPERRDIFDILARLKADGLSLIGQCGKEHVVGISLGLPGPYIRSSEDPRAETFTVSGFEELSLINIHQELEAAFGFPIVSEHDAKLQAYAEWKRSAERQQNTNASLMTVGSVGLGIGAGIIIGGKIVEGQLGVAGEIGHMGIHYNSGQADGGVCGTYEYMAGTDSPVRYMRERLYEFPDSALADGCSYDDIVAAYQKQDPLAVYAIDKMAWMLGYGIASLIYVINPDCVILEADYPNLPEFQEKVRQTVRRFVQPAIMEHVSIRCTELEDDPMLLGGYYLVLEKLFKNNEFLDKIRQALN